MHERFWVRVTKDYLVFSAGHFITFAGNQCERLHGHNYRITAEVFGPLDENHYVVDFVALRDALHAIATELDHHMLLPTQHPTIHVVADEREVTVTFEECRWVFPLCDCLLLPIPNTTTELLARYVGHKLLASLAARGCPQPERIRIAIDECEGQIGVCEIDCCAPE